MKPFYCFILTCAGESLILIVLQAPLAI